MNGTYLAVLMQRIPEDRNDSWSPDDNGIPIIEVDTWGSVDSLRLSTANFSFNDGTYDIAYLDVNADHLDGTHNANGAWPAWLGWHDPMPFISSENIFETLPNEWVASDWCMFLFKIPDSYDASYSDLSGLTSLDYMVIGATRVIGPWNGGDADTVRVEFDHGALGSPLFTGSYEFVPEPTSAMLLAAGCAALLLRRRRGPQGN
jgi:hypothetical protein